MLIASPVIPTGPNSYFTAQGQITLLRNRLTLQVGSQEIEARCFRRPITLLTPEYRV